MREAGTNSAADELGCRGSGWITAITRISPGARQALIAALVGLAVFCVYYRTLAVSIVWGDSPELTTAAFNAGVPHPTGYPLYMLLSHAFMSCFPYGSIAYRM